MSSPIWTPDALRSEAGAFRGEAWRMVEAQHRVSTLKLVDGLDEQAVLETILEDTKPPMPAECRHLDYLLATPFRYRPYPHGSRFRRAGPSPGVWYGAARPETAMAEMVFYRFLFLAESPETPFPGTIGEYTGFSAVIAGAAINLTEGALAKDAAFWLHPSDYAACQDLADMARQAEIGVIRYQSVRDPAGGMNLAVLTCRAFAHPAPKARQSWRLHIGPNGANAICDHPPRRLHFPRDSFAQDPRITDMRWDRPG